MGRSILAVLVGAIVGALLVFLVEWLNHVVYPPPAGLESASFEEIAAWVKAAPGGALLLVLVGWIVGSFGGGWIAAKLARLWKRSWEWLHGFVVGVLLQIGGTCMLIWIPHPDWLAVLGVLCFIPSALFGARLAEGRRG